ncbi:transcriptional activator of glycolytic enzymes-domain-containing protein [Dipodascopsis tothii]|uniref:transcriptional activator of glycolytic enzymes-domain-containing protein n=1 Tax=Dipodascopsis tothii TaxID=44089 RepID=UPI0034CE06C7
MRALQGSMHAVQTLGQAMDGAVLGTSDVQMHDPRLMGLGDADVATDGSDGALLRNVPGAIGVVGGSGSAGTTPGSAAADKLPGQDLAGGVDGQVSNGVNALGGSGMLAMGMPLGASPLGSAGQLPAGVAVTPVRSRPRRSMQGTPSYKMDRNTQSVDRFWEEWTVGINGSPSILTLNANYRASWRSEVAERKFYSQRLVLVRTIEWMVRTRGISVDDAVNELEKRRRDQNISLSRLCRILKDEESSRNG